MTTGSELPVVARCIVEVRSDGSLSVARGVLETKDESVLLEAAGNTPRELIAAIARGAVMQARARVSKALESVERKLLGGGG